jgi:hypothetical protein
MSWFIINPKTGKHVRHVKQPVKSGDRLYVNDLFSDGLHDQAWHFHEFLARYPTQPPLEDLSSFVIEGRIPASFKGLSQRKLTTHKAAFKRYWAEIDLAYQAFLGRPATRQEKYWMAHCYLWRMAIGKDRFYAKKVGNRSSFLSSRRSCGHSVLIAWRDGGPGMPWMPRARRSY